VHPASSGTALVPVVLSKTVLSKTILTKTSGFIAEAGFTHSLTPARNCTFGCTYCYVPTMRLQGGLKPEDWQRWGQFTTFKGNAAELLSVELAKARASKPEYALSSRASQEFRIYCSPLVDPYQPAEAGQVLMPAILEVLLNHPPRVFTVQTRGSLILRDLRLLKELAKRTTLRVSFSITTNRDSIRRLYEPHCASIGERLTVIRVLRDAGIETYATLAPLLPCDPEELARVAIEASGSDLIGDPLHVRAVKPRGATTREAAFRISTVHRHKCWFDPQFQEHVTAQIRQAARSLGHEFTTGPLGFSKLAA
jgi:DNA repair photolyase